MKASFSIHFNGRCEEAFRFYEEHLPAKLAFMLTWGDSPMAKDVPAEWAEKICHATLLVGDASICVGDWPPGTYAGSMGFGIVLNLDDPNGADRLFNVFAPKADVRVPLQETFWAGRYAMRIDEFGIPWELNCEKPVYEFER